MFVLILSTFIIFSSSFYEADKSLSELKSKKVQVSSLEEKNKLLKDELVRKILAQFNVWHLTSAESQIAMLLIKGFSSQEISVIRGSSERTVRKQATEIYRKTNQQGRAALAAFFLEDLL